MKVKKEIWKSICGYDLYEVSSFGRLASHKFRNRRVMNPVGNGSGYLQIKLCKNGTQKRVYIHRLVAEAFLDNPMGKRTVNHKNGIKTDNSAENLEWSTHSENVLHSFATLGRRATWLGKFGDSNNKSKAVIQLAPDGCFIARYGSQCEAGRAGFNQQKISSCCLGRRKTHAGFVWAFEKDYRHKEAA